MVERTHDSFSQRALGAAAGLLAGGSLFAASIIVHSRSISDAFDTLLPLLVGLIVSVGLFLRWRGFWRVALAYVILAAAVHVYAMLPRYPFGSLIAVVWPRLVIDISVLTILLLPSVRSYVRRQPSNHAMERTADRGTLHF